MSGTTTQENQAAAAPTPGASTAAESSESDDGTAKMPLFSLAAAPKKSSRRSSFAPAVMEHHYNQWSASATPAAATTTTNVKNTRKKKKLEGTEVNSTSSNMSLGVPPGVDSQHSHHPKDGELSEDSSTDLKHMLHVLQSNALIWVVPLLILVALSLAGITVVLMYFDTSAEHQMTEALTVAKDTGKRFGSELDMAITPLFSLAQFVHELEEFRDLPNAIAPLPMKLEDDGVKSIKFRNITGVCDDPTLTQRFEDVAGTIKQNAINMKGVLVNLQLVPEGVVCLVHPVVNTEDFPSGLALNSSGAIGHDLLSDPQRVFHAEESLVDGELVTVGPIQLVQCQGCDPIVEQAFIARLPILMDNHNITTHSGHVLPKRWGFAVALINWRALVEKTDLYEEFSARGWAFRLTRVDQNFDADTQEYQKKVVVLAETPDFVHKSANNQVVESKLDTTDSEWTIAVAYTLEVPTAWKTAFIALIVMVAGLIAGLAFMVLYQKQVHSELVKINLERAELSARSERDLNDFIAHEVRNPLSAAISACTFLSTTVQEEDQRRKQRQKQNEGMSIETSGKAEQQSLLWSSPDVHQTVGEDVSIISSSLHFINDLLRNMLDMHRAASRQLVLDPVESDLAKDILEPVAAMLHHRDRNFAVRVEIDDGVPSPLIACVDRLRLQQVILNLGRNAAKFTKEGKLGFVRLRARVADERDGSIQLLVEDSGQGIPEEKRRNLFGRFQESLDSCTQGTGVGLNLCKTLVNLMGGELYLDESYDSGVEGCPGARFVVHLKGIHPIIESLDQKDADSTTCGGIRFTNALDIELGETNTSAASGSTESTMSDCATPSVLPDRLSILYADDERILRKLAIRAFSKLRPEWTIEETASGEAALQLVETEQFDIIFLDQYYTSVERRLTGTETARAMRAKGVESIICGVSANDLEDAFLSSGADLFSTKPFATDQASLERFMTEALKKRT